MSVRIETVRKLELHEGDIVHVQVGGDRGDGQGVWVPTQDDLLETFAAWAPLMIDHSNGLVVTHHLVEPTILASKLNLSTWPPRLKP